MVENGTTHQLEELLENAESLKRASMPRAGVEEYIIVKLDKVIGVENIRKTDSSLRGTFKIPNGPFFLIFGHTEMQRFLKGDAQKIVSHFGLKGIKARVYILKNHPDVLLVIHSAMLNFQEKQKNKSEVLLEKKTTTPKIIASMFKYESTGAPTETKAIEFTEDDLPLFALSVSNFLFRSWV